MRVAQQLSLKGFVRNLADGSVYIEVEGPELNVSELVDWCKKGPPLSKISYVTTIEGSWQGFDEFEIK